MKKKILIIDNNIDQPWPLGSDFIRYIPDAECVARRGPQSDFPLSLDGFTHLLMSGSKTSCSDNSDWVMQEMDLIRSAANRNMPILGVCFGHQIMARAFGALVGTSKQAEYGWVAITQTAKHPLLGKIPDTFHTFESHREEVLSLPNDFVVTARSERTRIQAYYHKSKPMFGIQFHPEKNAAEGQKSIDSAKKTAPKDCIFGDGKANSLYSENVAKSIFELFIRL